MPPHTQVIQIGMDTHIPSLFQAINAIAPIKVVLATNIDYDQESEVLLRYKTRYERFRDYELLREPHYPEDQILNHGQTTVLIDNLNMWASNHMLMANTFGEHAKEHTIKQLKLAFETLKMWQDHTKSDIYVLTASLEDDHFLRTEQGLLYQNILYEVNRSFLETFPHAEYGIWVHNIYRPIPRLEA